MRLELARTFFLKEQDELARRHFEAVLAGGVPGPVAANIRQFLAIMQSRKRLTGYFGMAVAPDSNLNATSESEIIYIDTVFGRLPFTREGDVGAESGFGLSVWGGGEYQHPVAEHLRLRVGSDVAVREYPGGNFDQHFVAAQRQWLGSAPYSDEFGARLELDRRLGPTVWARGTAAYRERDHLGRDFLDGPVAEFTASFAWTPAPVLRVHMTVGYARDHAALEHWCNLSRWVRIGAEPRVHRVRLQPAVGTDPRYAPDQRAGTGLRPQSRGASVRAAVLTAGRRGDASHREAFCPSQSNPFSHRNGVFSAFAPVLVGRSRRAGVGITSCVPDGQARRGFAAFRGRAAKFTYEALSKAGARHDGYF